MHNKNWFSRFLAEVVAHLVSNLIAYSCVLAAGLMWQFRDSLLAWIEQGIRLTRGELLGLLSLAVGFCVSVVTIRRISILPPNPPRIFEFPPERVRVGLPVRWNAEYRDANPTNKDDEVRLTLLTCGVSRVTVLCTVKLSDLPELNYLSNGTVLEVSGRVTVAGDPIHLEGARLRIYPNP